MDYVHKAELYTITVFQDLPKLRSTIVDDETFLFIMSNYLVIICLVLTVFGTVSNITNVVVFTKQGFKDNVNIGLLALAVSDLLSVILLSWSNLCYIRVFQNSVYPLVSEEIHVISGSWPHLVFTRTTALITMFISMERCMCVTLPLKVKNIFTRKVHIVTMVTIFVVTIGCSSYAYVVIGIGWKLYPERNASLLGIVYRIELQTMRIIDSISYTTFGVIMPLTCFISVVIFTIILVVKLNQQVAWRNAMVKENREKLSRNMSNNAKEQKIAKMIVFISTIFIISFLPAVRTMVATYVEPELGYGGFYKNLFLLMLSISFGADAINSSINIFVYLLMNTKYQETFLNMVQR